MPPFDEYRKMPQDSEITYNSCRPYKKKSRACCIAVKRKVDIMKLLCLLLVVFVIITCFCINLIESKLKVVRHTFEVGLDDWKVENQSWLRLPFSRINKDHPNIAKPSTLNSTMMMVPDNKTKMAVMSKVVTVPPNTNLEIFFTCLVLGWKKQTDVWTRINNPVLQILYDEVVVFNLDIAISENSGHYSSGKWNQFRLFSSYESNFTMKLTVMGSPGKSNPSSLVAVDNIIIKMATNESRNVTNKGVEPETDFKSKDGIWEKISAESEEEEKNATKNGTISSRPEFCDLLAERGPCHGSWPRYYYNGESNRCERFFYGGCNGNENNFHVKMACEAICLKPKKSEDATIFDVIFGHPLLPNVNGDMKKEDKARENEFNNLTLDFEGGFSDWNAKYWILFPYNSQRARNVNITKSLNASSRQGASPISTHNTIFRRPRMMHPIHLLDDYKLTLRFNLKLVGQLNPLLHPFFESVNPGFKVYVGDYQMFDYVLSGELDDEWHNYTITRETNLILNFPHLSNRGMNLQIIRIEAWQGSGDKGYVVLDDVFFMQTKETPTNSSSTNNGSNNSITSSTSSSNKDTSIPTITEQTSTTLAGMANATKPISALDKATFPFPCYLEVSKGPCINPRKRYYFNKRAGKCEEFTYGGCKGNANNFQTYDTCYSKCVKQMYGGGTTKPTIASSPIHITPISDDNTIVCARPRQIGHCHGYLERYYYSTKLKRCIPFMFSGCAGNGNNFASKVECQDVCMTKTNSSSPMSHEGVEFVTVVPRIRSDCNKPIKKGICAGSMNMYGYDMMLGKCRVFTYTGCAGNANRFFSLSSCKSVCEKSEKISRPFVRKPWQRNPISHKPIICQLPRSKTNSNCPISNSTKYYYYDKTTNTCELFRTCTTSSSSSIMKKVLAFTKHNQFYTRQGCENTCVHEGKSFSFNIKTCLLAPVEGPCRHYSTRYFYDPEESKCLTFIYGGCFGNKNNFRTNKICQQTCNKAENKAELSQLEKNSSAICYLSDIAGPCKGSIRRFFYDPDSHTCLPFTYGGCGGNENRFVREEDCVIRCMPWASKAMIRAAKERDDAAGDSNELENQSSSPLIIAEVVLGTILLILFLVALGLSYRLHKAKENYRIFTNQQRRDDSVDGSLSDSIAGVNPAAMAYDNPVFMDRSESTVGNNEHDSETNPPPFSNNTREESSKGRKKSNGNESTNSFPLKNGSFFSRGSRSERESTSSDPKVFEPLPSIVGQASHYSNDDVSQSSLKGENAEAKQQNASEKPNFADIFNF